MTRAWQPSSRLNRGSRTTGIRSLKQQSLLFSPASWIAVGRFPVSHCLIALALLLTNTIGVHAQRHGRADAIQNYMGAARNPQLLLQIRNEKTRLYFRASDLRNKPRSVVTMTDSVTGLSHTYEGVRLERLVPNGTVIPGSGTLEVFPEHQRKVTIQCSDADFQATPLVADIVDGKKLTGCAPYYFVVKTREGSARALQAVHLIVVKTSTN